jgi:hypothetical protein
LYPIATVPVRFAVPVELRAFLPIAILLFKAPLPPVPAYAPIATLSIASALLAEDIAKLPIAVLLSASTVIAPSAPAPKAALYSAVVILSPAALPTKVLPVAVVMS